MIKHNRNKSLGFTMVELLLVISVMAVLGLLAAIEAERKARESLAETVGAELIQLSAAVDSFITAYYGGLAGMDAAGNPIALDPLILPNLPTHSGVVCNGTNY